MLMVLNARVHAGVQYVLKNPVIMLVNFDLHPIAYILMQHNSCGEKL